MNKQWLGDKLIYINDRNIIIESEGYCYDGAGAYSEVKFTMEEMKELFSMLKERGIIE